LLTRPYAPQLAENVQVVMTEGAAGGLSRLRRAVRDVQVPEATRAMFEAEPGDPLPCQLWRVRWRDFVELVLLVDVGEDVEATPVSLDDECADETSVVLRAEQASLGTRLAVWAGLARRLPMCVLDRQFGTAAVDVRRPGWVDAAVAAGAERGRAPSSPLDPLVMVRARLVDTMESLSDATWAPSGSGKLADLLASRVLTPQRLVELLDITPQRAMALRRGQSPVTASEAGVLADALSISEQAVLDANPPPPAGLVERMSRPRRRAQVCRLAANRGVNEHHAWVAATYAVYAQAARQTGPGAEAAWDDRIDRYFQVTLEG
jgi:plasmid maintenance system antidote protein VapI